MRRAGEVDLHKTSTTDRVPGCLPGNEGGFTGQQGSLHPRLEAMWKTRLLSTAFADGPVDPNMAYLVLVDRVNWKGLFRPERWDRAQTRP